MSRPDRDEPQRPFLGLHVMHRRSSATLRRLLHSLWWDGPDGETRCHFDEIVLLDTGPGESEGLEEVLEDFAADVRCCDPLVRLVAAEGRFPSIPYTGQDGEERLTITDFGAARNALFRLGTARWRMFLDADDTLEWTEADGVVEPRLSDWLRQETASGQFRKVNGISLSYSYRRDGGGGDTVRQDRRCAWQWCEGMWQWEGPLHELCEPGPRNPGAAVLPLKGGAVWRIDHHGRPGESAARNRAILDRVFASGVLPPEGRSKTLRPRLCYTYAAMLLDGEDAEQQRKGEELAGYVVDHYLDVNAYGYQMAMVLSLWNERRGEIDQAKAWLLRAVEAQPYAREGLVRLGRHYLLEAKPDRAAELYRRAYLAPVLDTESSMRNPTLEDLHGRLDGAQALAVEGEGELARRILDEAPGWAKRDPRHDIGRARVERTIGLNTSARAVLDLVHAMLGSDEAERAEKLLSTLPPRLTSHALVKKARDLTRRRLDHLHRAELYAEGYAPCTVADIGSVYGRPHLRSLLRRAVELDARRYIDVGCGTGWLVVEVALALPEVRAVGVEVSPARVEAARTRAEEAGVSDRVLFLEGAADACLGAWVREAEQHLGDRADLLTCAEVIEHVADPRIALDNFLCATRQNGTIIITTPDAWRYEYLQDCSWRLDTDLEAQGLPISESSRAEHVRVYDPHSLVDELRAAGLDPVRLEYEDAFHGDDEAETPSGDSTLICLEARNTGPLPRGKRLDIYAEGWIAWGPRAHETGFVGGSEQAVCHLAPRLARLGWDVHVYADRIDRPTWHRGVYWHRCCEFMPAEPRDAVIVWRRSDRLLGCKIGSDGRWPVIYWAHDVPTPEGADRYDLADSVWTLSAYHRELYEAHVAPSKIVDLANGIDLEALGTIPEAGGPGERAPHRVVYGSSWDRGLLILLDLWPAVVARHPDAELHVTYSGQLLECAASQPGQRELAAEVRRLAASLPSVGLHDGLPHPAFLELLRTSSILAYPCIFPEIYGIVPVEAQAEGCLVVGTDKGALGELVLDGAIVPHADLRAYHGIGEDEPVLWNLPARPFRPGPNPYLEALLEALEGRVASRPKGHPVFADGVVTPSTRATLSDLARRLYDWSVTATRASAAIEGAIHERRHPT